jgi:hypothetical protein
MPEEHLQAGEADETEGVFYVVFASGKESAKVVHPTEKTLRFPTFFVEPQQSSILGLAASAAVRRNQFDAVRFFKFFIEPIQVVGFVPNESGGQFVEEASGQNFFHKLALGWRSALHRYGERKTVSSGEFGDQQSISRMPSNQPSAIYETGSRASSTC